jgi:hypothetical protein
MKKISGNVRNYPSDSKLPSSTVSKAYINVAYRSDQQELFCGFESRSEWNPDPDPQYYLKVPRSKYPLPLLEKDPDPEPGKILPI